MRPTLFELGGWAVPSYPTLMVVGYLLALATVYGLARGPEIQGDGGLNRPQVWDLFIVMVVSSVFGSKMGHVLFEASGHRGVTGVFDLLRQDPWHPLRLDEPGYVWYGGMLAALGVAVYYFRRRPYLNAWLLSDAFAPAIMLGATAGRVGCFLAGCCYGVPTTQPWGVTFSMAEGPVHPTQLYDAFLALTVGVVLLWRFGRRRFDGENLALLLMVYPLARSITEIFRGDPERGMVGPLSTSQAISVPLFVVGAVLFLYRFRKGEPASIRPMVKTGDLVSTESESIEAGRAG